jgi:signal transduction histidine kinase
MPPPSSEIPDHARAGDGEGLSRECDRWVLEMVERDRLRLAGALHNSVCQSLSGLQLLTATCLKRLPEKSGALAEEVGELARLLRQVSTELREVVQWLRSAPMREEGLIVSLLEFAAEISRAIPCEFRCDDRRIEVDPWVAAQLYQIAHAAVLSVAQRRVATRIEIELAAQPQNGLVLSVWDDANPSQTAGPASEPDLCNWELLHVRARAIGGKLSFDSPESGGTTVTCHVAINAVSGA